MLPYGWGNQEFCKNSKHFNESKWIQFREKLRSIYSQLYGSHYLVDNFKLNWDPDKSTDDYYQYWLLKIS